MSFLLHAAAFIPLERGFIKQPNAIDVAPSGTAGLGVGCTHDPPFRHLKATMEYHRTKDTLHVQKLLGHKRIESTMLYTQLVKFEGGSEYISRVTNSLQGARSLVEAGFEYVCDLDAYKLFRKRA